MSSEREDDGAEVLGVDPTERVNAHFLQEPARSLLAADAAQLAADLGLSPDRVQTLVFHEVEANDESPAILLSELRRAATAIGPEAAMDVLGQDGAAAVRSRAVIAELLGGPEIPLFTLSELSNHLQAFASHLESNRDHLLATGHPRTQYVDSTWLRIRLGWLYPVKSPVIVGVRRREDGAFEYEYHWATAVLRDGRTASLPYERAPLRDGLEYEWAARMERLRGLVLEAKLKALRGMAEGLRSRSEEGLLKSTLLPLSKELTFGDVEFLLDQDHRCRNFGPHTEFEIGSRYPVNSPPSVAGGIAGVLDVLYHCEREVRAGPMDAVKTEILAFAERHDIPVLGTLLGKGGYYECLCEPWRSEFDALLDRHFERDRAAWLECPWDDFAARAEKFLGEHLQELVTVRAKVKREHAEPVRDKMDGLIRILRDGLDVTGEMPRILIGAADERMAAANTFRREGRIWTIQYSGKTTRLRDGRGARILYELIQKPKTAISSSDLRKAATGHDMGTDVGSAGDAIDEETKTSLKDKLEQLRAERADAESANDPGRIERINGEVAAIDRYLKSGAGLAGRTRVVGSRSDQARQSVAKALDRLLKEIESQDRALWQHLKNSVSRGHNVMYDPETDPNWRF